MHVATFRWMYMYYGIKKLFHYNYKTFINYDEDQFPL